MRKSVSTSEVLDFFANKLQSEAYASQAWNHSGFSLAYKDDWILYSNSRYTPFARWVKNKQGHEALLIMSQQTNITNAHLWRLERASSHVRKIFAPVVMSDNHAEQFDNWKQDALLLLDRVKRCRKINRIVQFFEDIKVRSADYAEFFGVDVPKDLADVLNQKGDSLAEIRERIEKARLQQIKDDEKDLKRHLESVKAFRENRNHWVVRYAGVNFKDKAVGHNLLRYNEDNNRIETSGGVQIPYTLAKRFFVQIHRALRDNKLDTLVGQKVLQYTVKRANPTELFIGCHTVPMSEINLIGQELDWFRPQVLGLAE